MRHIERIAGNIGPVAATCIVIDKRSQLRRYRIQRRSVYFFSISNLKCIIGISSIIEGQSPGFLFYDIAAHDKLAARSGAVNCWNRSDIESGSKGHTAPVEDIESGAISIGPVSATGVSIDFVCQFAGHRSRSRFRCCSKEGISDRGSAQDDVPGFTRSDRATQGNGIRGSVTATRRHTFDGKGGSKGRAIAVDKDQGGAILQGTVVTV